MLPRSVVLASDCVKKRTSLRSDGRLGVDETGPQLKGHDFGPLVDVRFLVPGWKFSFNFVLKWTLDWRASAVGGWSSLVRKSTRSGVKVSLWSTTASVNQSALLTWPDRRSAVSILFLKKK